jgi:tol-pal system protein YbgF
MIAADRQQMQAIDERLRRMESQIQDLGHSPPSAGSEGNAAPAAQPAPPPAEAPAVQSAPPGAPPALGAPMAPDGGEAVPPGASAAPTGPPPEAAPVAPGAPSEAAAPPATAEPGSSEKTIIASAPGPDAGAAAPPGEGSPAEAGSAPGAAAEAPATEAPANDEGASEEGGTENGNPEAQPPPGASAPAAAPVPAAGEEGAPPAGEEVASAPPPSAPPENAPAAVPSARWPEDLAREAQSPSSSKGGAGKLFHSGLDAMKSRDYSAAVDRFGILQKKYPHSDLTEPAAYFSASALNEMGKYDQAILQYNDLVMRYPNGKYASEALLREAKAFVKINDKVDARLTLQKLVNEHAGTPQAGTAGAMMKNLESD